MSGVVAGKLRSCAWVAVVAAALAAIAGDAAPASPAAVVKTLMQRELEDLPGKEAILLSVEYPPAGASLPHRHVADVMVYVLEGQVLMQLEGQPARTLGPGGTFYEGPADVHVRSANASATTPAKFLVFMLKDRGRPASLPVASRAAGERP